MNDDPDYNKAISSKSPHFLNEEEMNDSIRDLVGLTKSNAELLKSRLQEWNSLDSSCKVKFIGKGISLLCLSSHILNPILYATVPTCMDFYEIYNPADWCLFIDSSATSLKEVLLHNWNIFPSIPLAQLI